MASRLLLLGLVAASAAALATTVAVTSWIRSQPLPPLSAIESYAPPQVTEIRDREGRPIARLYRERRRVVPLHEVPPHVVRAFVAAEDGAFFEHAGVDPSAVVRAAWANLRRGEIVQGASTITQQVVKNLWLSRERTLARKLREAHLAVQLERLVDKQTILHVYLNHIYLGSGAYGVEEAARTYFGKSIGEVSLSEGALLAGLPGRPSSYSPHVNPRAAEARRRYVLRRMLADGWIQLGTYVDALGRPPAIRDRERGRVDPDAAHFVAEVRRALDARLPAGWFERGGLVVETTLDLEAQVAAQAALRRGLDRIRERHGETGDTSTLEGAVLSLEVDSGDVLTMVGGRDYGHSPYNRAVRARRQVGSIFKTFVYAAALEQGYTGASMLIDEPFFHRQPDGEIWSPRNYDGSFRGRVTLREAMAHSINCPTVYLFEHLGRQPVLRLARDAGIRSRLPAYPSLALGATELSLLEVTRAYGAMASQGMRRPARIIHRVRDADGREILSDVLLGEEASAVEPSRVVSPEVAYVVTDLLRAVVNEGTARGARIDGVPVAGKTGTTNANTDAWFVGYSRDVVTGVWVGRDDNRPIGRRETGSRAALPIWREAMTAVLADRPARRPSFPRPKGIVFEKIDADTGLLADAFSERRFHQAFVRGTEPTEAPHRSFFDAGWVRLSLPRFR